MNIKKTSPISLLIGLHLFIILLTVVFLAINKGKPPKDREKIVVLPIEGVISMESRSLSSGHSVDSIVKTLQNLAEDNNVKALVLRINSPGGSVGAVQEIYRALKKFKGKGKFIVSSFGDVAASGGYYLAVAGDKIICNPGTITGSIGVVMQLPNFQGFMSKIGIAMETIKSGRMKDAGSPFRRLSLQERHYFKELILDAYDQFFHAVKEGRHMDGKILRKLADGRIFSGRMAMQNKLVDGFGGVDDAIKMATQIAGLEHKNPVVIYHKPKHSLDQLLQFFNKSPLLPLEKAGDTHMKLLYLMQ